MSEIKILPPPFLFPQDSIGHLKIYCELHDKTQFNDCQAINNNEINGF